MPLPRPSSHLDARQARNHQLPPPLPRPQRRIPLRGRYGARTPSARCHTGEAVITRHVPSAVRPVLPAQPSGPALSAPSASFQLRHQTRAAPSHRGRGPAGDGVEFVTLTREVGLKPSPSRVLLATPGAGNLERRHQSKLPDQQGTDSEEGERIRQAEKFSPALAPSSSCARFGFGRLSSPRRPRARPTALTLDVT